MEGASLPGKSRAPRTTAPCALRLKAGLGRVQPSVRRNSQVSAAPSWRLRPAGPCHQNHDGHPAETTAPLTTHCPIAPLTPQSPVAPNPTSPAGEGAGAPRKVPRTSDYSALFDEFNMGLDGCNPRFAETYRSLQHRGKVPPILDDSALFDEFDMGLDGCNPRFAETHRSLLHPGKSCHRTRSLPTARRAGHCEARKAGIVGERLDGVPGNHPSPETVFRHCPPPDAGEGSDARLLTTRVRRRGGRAGRRG